MRSLVGSTEVDTLKECPNYHRRASGGLFGGQYFVVYQCGGCKRYYCWQCHNSNGGRKCPHCYSEQRSEHAKVYAEP